MAKEIPITQAMPAHYFRGGGKRPGRGAMAPRRATIGIGGGKKEGGSSGGEGSSGPASRTVPMGDDEQGPPAVETQAPIEATGRVPSFAVGNAANGVIDLSSILSAKTNANYDPTKAIGGENVPFKETTGVGGFFRRMFGDNSNERNLAAQAQQGAEWKQQAALDAQAAREDSRWQKRFDAESGARAKESQLDRDARKAERDAAAEQHRIERAEDWVRNDERFEQQQIDAIRDRDLQERRFKASQDQNTQELDLRRKTAEGEAADRQARFDLMRDELDLKRGDASQPKINFGPDGVPYITQGGTITRVDPTRLPVGKIPGSVGGPKQLFPFTSTASGAPTAKPGESTVNPITGQPTGTSSPGALQLPTQDVQPVRPPAFSSPGWSLSGAQSPAASEGLVRRNPRMMQDEVVMARIPKESDPRIGRFTPEAPDITAEDIAAAKAAQAPKAVSDEELQAQILDAWQKGALPTTIEAMRAKARASTQPAYMKFSQGNRLSMY